MTELPKPRWPKFVGAGLAYLPMLVFLFAIVAGLNKDNPIFIGCSVFLLPALSFSLLINSFISIVWIHSLVTIGLILLWSSFVAWFFWRCVGIFQGEEEAEDQHGKYDWTAFRLRFLLGFIVGFLFSWRFVAYTHSWKVLLAACLTGGVVCGFLYGISRPPDFWSRP